MLHPSYEIISQLFLKHTRGNSSVIVDYGCGNGRLLEIIPHEQISTYHGYDVNPDSLAIAHQKYHNNKNTTFTQFSAGEVPTLGRKKSVDVIILIGVLQYMTAGEIEQFILQSKYVLKPGGTIIASCVVDHLPYRLTNLYQFIFPNFYINRQKLIGQLTNANFSIDFAKEKGLILGPLISHGLVIFFDILDKLIFRNKGELGAAGKFIRHLSFPLLRWENNLNIDYGYTFYFVATKK